VRASDDGQEAPQIYGSNQIELAWTVIPVLIVVVLFRARVIRAVEDARFPPGTTEITTVGHQFWWEFQYPEQGFIAANELHPPVRDTKHPTPTHITLLSADTNHIRSRRPDSFANSKRSLSVSSVMWFFE